MVSGRVSAVEISEGGESRRFVEEIPRGHAVAQRAGYNVRVVGETSGKITIGPASGVFECLWQVPVIQRQHRTKLCFEKRIHEAAVEVEPLLVGLA